MSRPVDWSPLAGGDPVPGDPDRIEHLGRHYRRVAQAINDAAAKLRRIADHQDMQSDAVEAFRNTAREVADDITRAHERYDGVGQALTGYAPQLRDAQSESVAALVQAKQAEADELTANRLAHAAQGRIDAAPDGADTTTDRGSHRRALAAADAATEARAAAQRRLDQATGARDAAAQRASSLIHEIKDSGDLNDSWWDNWGAKVVRWIVKIADFVAVVAGLLALLVGWIPIIGQALAAVLGTIALVASLVSLLGNIALAATGQVGWSAVASSTLGVLSFGVGRAAMAGLKVSVQGARGASRLAAGRLAAQSPAARAAAGLPSSGSSMAAIRLMLGTAKPMTRRAARTAAQQSQKHGLLPSAGSIARNLHALPGEFGSNVRALRNADWGEALRQARHGGRPSMMQALGQHDAASGMQNVNRVHDAVRASDEVAPHLSNAIRQRQLFEGSTASATLVTMVTGDGLVPSPTPSDALRLPPADRQPDMAGAGAPP